MPWRKPVLPSDSIVQEFTKETSIHGLLRICSQERRWSARAIWTLLFLAVNATLIYQTRTLVVRYFSYPSVVVTTLEFEMFNFPSVTICNQNPIGLYKTGNTSDIWIYQDAYRKLLSLGEKSVSQSELLVLCYNVPMLCTGISIQSCDKTNGACTTKQIRSTTLNSSSCYLNGSECGAFEVESLFGNICMQSDGSLATECNTTTTAPSSTTVSPSSKRHTRGAHKTTTSSPYLTPKTTIALSMLQMNSKVNNDMNYLISNALNSNDDMVIEQYQNALVNISDFIQDCSFGTTQCDINANFVAVRNSVYGLCFTFNHVNSSMMNESTIVGRAGSAFGLRLRLNIGQDQYLYSTDVIGARVAIHNQGEQPFPETVGYSAQVSSRTSIGVTMVQTTRLPKPYGNCVDNSNIHGYSHVPYFYPGNYTSQGCIFSCVAIKIAAMCGCIHQNYPHPQGILAVSFGNTSSFVDASSMPFCDLSMKPCADNAESLLLDSGQINSNNCGCYPPCFEVDFQATISVSNFPSETYLDTIRCPPNNDSNAGCYNDIQRNQLQVEVFCEQLNYQRFVQESAYPLSTLISDFGGQMALWVGASLLSLAEAISFFISITGQILKIFEGDVERKSTKIRAFATWKTCPKIPRKSKTLTETEMKITPKPERFDDTCTAKANSKFKVG